MASELAKRITLVQDNPYGTYVTGDVIDVYYDPDADTTTSGTNTYTGFTVELNGSPISSGPQLVYEVFPTGTYYTVTNFNVERCKGTTRISIVFSSFGFPYAYGMRYPDHPSCTIDSPSCDLEFTGVPSTTDASNETALDGSITVSATSSNSIEFKLGEDFVYGDGTGQSSGTFTGLGRGTYTIYARDSLNCSAVAQAQIGRDSPYAAQYRLQYYDRLGYSTRVEIRKLDYEGSVTDDVCGTGEPFELMMRGENDPNKFRVIFGGEAVLNLLSTTNFEWSFVFTNNPKELQMVYLKDFGSGYEIQWTGFILPHQYSEPYIAPKYPVSITAVDNLHQLDRLFLADGSGLRFNGTIKAIELIAFCLKKTGLIMNIRCACNIYASGMNSTDTDDPLDQAYVDFDVYYLAENEPTLMFVIQKTLDAFGARIVQWQNRWNIIRVEELRSEFDYREFDEDGVYSSNGSFDPIATSDCTSIKWLATPTLQILPGYGAVKISYSLGLLENILRNGDFRLKAILTPSGSFFSFDVDTFGFQIISPDYSLARSREDIDENNIALTLTGGSDTTGTSYVVSDSYTVKMGSNNSLRFVIRVKIPSPRTSGGQAIDVPYIKIIARITFGTFYLKGDGTWTTNLSYIVFYAKEFDKYQDFEVIAGTAPDTGAISGYSLTARLYHPYIYQVDYTDLTSIRAITTTSLGLGTRIEAVLSGYFASDHIFYYELEENTEAENPADIIRPDDYNAGSNAVQWIRKANNSVLEAQSEHKIFIDSISINFLTDGKPPTNVRVIDKKAESDNDLVLTKEIIHGSFKESFTTLPTYGFAAGIFGVPASGTFQLSLETATVLSAAVLYTGFFRDSSGAGFGNWTRDGISESTTLEEILMVSLASQYNSSYKRLSGSIRPNSFLGFLNTFVESVDSDTKYIQMGCRILDKSAQYDLELLELTDIDAAGSSGSAFTTGFKQSGFR